MSTDDVEESISSKILVASNDNDLVHWQTNDGNTSDAVKDDGSAILPMSKYCGQYIVVK